MRNQQKLDKWLQQQLEHRETFSLAVGIQSSDNATHYRFAGGTISDADSTPMQSSTPFFLASISKMYTAVVVMQLVDEGILDLNAPIASYLPQAMLNGIHSLNDIDYVQQIRVEHLLSHTSGLPDYFDDPTNDGPSLTKSLLQGQDVAVDLDWVLEIVRRQTPHFPPGEGAHYADTNFQLLQAIIETTTSIKLEEHLQSRVFGPLNLQNTAPFTPDRLDTPRQPAIFYNRALALHLPQFLSTTVADGGLVGTLDDVLRFLQAFFEHELLPSHLVKQMTATWNGIGFPLQYGLGLMRIKLPRIMSPLKPIPELIGHSGSTGAFAYAAPAHGMYVVGTTNQTHQQRRAFQLMLRVINMAL